MARCVNTFSILLIPCLCLSSQIEYKMAAILRVVLGEDNVAVMDLPNGIPPELEDLQAEIKRLVACWEVLDCSLEMQDLTMTL